MSKISEWWERQTRPKTITPEAVKSDIYRLCLWGGMFVAYGLFIGMDWKKGNWPSLVVDVFFAALFYLWLAETWCLHQRRKQALANKGRRDQRIKDLG